MARFEPQYISAVDLANRLGVSRQYIQKCLAEGKIKAIKVGCRWRIPIDVAKKIEKDGI